MALILDLPGRVLATTGAGADPSDGPELALHFTTAFCEKSRTLFFLISSRRSSTAAMTLSPASLCIVPRPSAAASLTGAKLSSSPRSKASDNGLKSVFSEGGVRVDWRLLTRKRNACSFTCGFLCFAKVSMSSVRSDIDSCTIMIQVRELTDNFGTSELELADSPTGGWHQGRGLARP